MSYYDVVIVSVIPARGGSKGIEYKNIIPFLGNPLLSYTVTQSVTSDSIDHTFVSTDDENIASVGREYGAEIIERPDELAGDEATTESALLHAVETMQERDINPDIVVLLQCTSPLRRSGDITRTVELLTEEGYDSALSVCEDHKFYWETGNNGAEPVNYDPANRKRRQDLEQRYQENGSIYAVRTGVFETHECRLGGQIGLNTMPKSLSFEIDDKDDLRIVESIGRNVEFHTGELDVDYDSETTTEVDV
ncbi:acylneuraminate cytidylyltransferase family protein [Halogeometricum pallidum]|uniref:acylneuraminate cytidylyltransferase family protein n=1 Tax=Halogeometricum pallidum TaxID=411361 RepID=UPI001360B380|nr:acylneuraminate cytidylyltransferase family protein [Halogeometricum pallidum]